MAPSPSGVDDHDIFALMEEARAEDARWADVEEDEDNAPAGVVCYLPDGDVHICRGIGCQFLELNDDGCYACMYSGLVAGPKSVRTDYSTGRQAGSADPDAHAGEPVGGSWKPKKDSMGLSKMAYDAAASIPEDTELYVSPSIKKPPRTPAKRGARCVDEPADPTASSPKRARAARKTNQSREAFYAMCQDAEVTMTKLVAFDKKPVKEKASRDPRLMDKDLLFAAAIKRYLKECTSTGTAPTLDAIHNLAIAAANIAEEERRKAAVESGRAALLLKVRMREQITALAVTLWNASVETPYMLDARRGSDSFRPFVCGVLYGLKRGVSLPDGQVVVPSCPELAAALPALRATAANSTAKALHASSHRGLCTLHRCISSCSAEQAADIYGNAARLASQLAASVRNGRFDL